MKRGDIVLCRLKSSYTSKARPCVVIQSNEVVQAFESITVCPITSHKHADTSSFRIEVRPTKSNQLKKTSFVMVDKISTFPKSVISDTSGTLSPTIIKNINTAIQLWLAIG